MRKIDSNVVQKWEKALDGIKSDYMAEVTAQLLENQAKAVLTEASKLTEEQLTPGAPTVGKLGTFQKFAFPIVRRVFPDLIFNMIGSTQPMEGPVSQIFYIGNSRAGNNGANQYTQQNVYSKYNLTYGGTLTIGYPLAWTFSVGAASFSTTVATGLLIYGSGRKLSFSASANSSTSSTHWTGLENRVINKAEVLDAKLPEPGPV